MGQFSEIVRRKLARALSYPERTIRSLASIVVGASTLLTEVLLPESLRETTIYQITLGLMQQYILEKVADMAHDPAQDPIELGEDYVRRKMAGTALEAAGLLTIGFSPLWVFAIAGDVAGGSKVYLNRLIAHLKDNGVLHEETRATDLVDLLEAVQQATRESATAVDMPPISREKLSELAAEMKKNYGRVFGHTTDLLSRLDDLWEGMEKLTRREKIPLERLGGVMTLNAVSWSRMSVDMVQAASQTGIELLDEEILESYKRTLAGISEKGLDTYIRDHMRPFLQAARSHYDTSRITWTEKRLGRDASKPA
jgi:hypothetical protein